VGVGVGGGGGGVGGGGGGGGGGALGVGQCALKGRQLPSSSSQADKHQKEVWLSVATWWPY